MSWFDYYTLAFRKVRDYSNITTRKEYNFFILCFFLIYMLMAGILFPIFIYVSISEPNKSPLFFSNAFGAVSWIVCLIHALPALALIKRRLNDIFPIKSGVIFRIFFTFEIIRILLSLILYSNMSSLLPLALTSNNVTLSPNIVTVILMFLLNQLLCYISLGFYIFLMVKKGKQ